MGSALSAEDSVDKSWSRLGTCYEAFSTQNSCRWIDVAREGVDCNDVRRGFVPRAVLSPVGCRYFIPAVVERVRGGENPHCAALGVARAGG